jgi:16S rRNA U1498 N3-methylase RsmE
MGTDAALQRHGLGDIAPVWIRVKAVTGIFREISALLRYAVHKKQTAVFVGHERGFRNSDIRRLRRRRGFSATSAELTLQTRSGPGSETVHCCRRLKIVNSF